MQFITSTLLAFFIAVTPTIVSSNTTASRDTVENKVVINERVSNLHWVTSDKFITIMGFLLTSTVISGIGSLLKSQLKGEMTEYVRDLFDREEGMLTTAIEDKFDKYSESLQVITNLLETMSKERIEAIKETDRLHYLVAEIQLRQQFSKEYTDLMFTMYEKAMEELMSTYMMSTVILGVDKQIKKIVKEEMLAKYKEYYPNAELTSLFSA